MPVASIRPLLVSFCLLSGLAASVIACGGGTPDPEDVAEEEARQRKWHLRQTIGMGKELPAGCQILGQVMGTGGGGGWTSTQMKMDDAQDELREKTAQLGGNHVVMDATASDVFGISITGRALRCEPGVNATSASANGATTAPQAQPEQTPEMRLRKLDELHDQKLITDEEYERRRREIIDSI